MSKLSVVAHAWENKVLMQKEDGSYYIIDLFSATKTVVPEPKAALVVVPKGPTWDT